MKGMKGMVILLFNPAKGSVDITGGICYNINKLKGDKFLHIGTNKEPPESCNFPGVQN